MYHFQINSYSIDGPSRSLAITGAVALYLMQAVAYWYIFKKAGEKKGRAFVPVLNTYTQYKLSWSKTAFWVILGLCVVVGVFSGTNMVTAMVPFSYNVTIIAWLAIAIMHIISCVKLSKSFGHGFGWALGLMLLPQVFMLTIGLGGSGYFGKDGKNEEQ